MTAFILNSRKHSTRVPGKAFTMYNGKPQIEHLIDRLIKTEIKVFVAVPHHELNDYKYLENMYIDKVFVSAGYDNDPLHRMFSVAAKYNITEIIRVTHDKIFVDENMVWSALNKFKESGLDYLYSSDFIPGTGFEIISFAALQAAANKFTNVEHISYAIRFVTKNILDWYGENNWWSVYKSFVRLLVDYPEDVSLMNVLFSGLGSEASLKDVIEFVEKNRWVRNINKLPEVTIYTCAYNAEKWLDECMGSVSSQLGFRNFEYLLIDDSSTDKTPIHMAKFCHIYKNAKWTKNAKNIGLSSSSNVALANARGRYIIRLDADDLFCDKRAIVEMVEEMKQRDLEAIYPNNYLGHSRKNVQNGKEHHHVGGTLFNTSAINHLKFTDGLRNFEGLDLFGRAQPQIKIGYLNKPMFIYRQHDQSMSKTNLEERSKIKKELVEKYGTQVVVP